MAGALSAHANAVLSALTVADQRLCRTVLLRLCTPERTRVVVSLPDLLFVREVEHEGSASGSWGADDARTSFEVMRNLIGDFGDSRHRSDLVGPRHTPQTGGVTNDDLIIVEALVTGPRGTFTGRFVLDTGAAATTMTHERADLIGYSSRDGFQVLARCSICINRPSTIARLPQTSTDSDFTSLASGPDRTCLHAGQPVARCGQELASVGSFRLGDR